MAEKGFGVKEINLIGASGTPTITSPNNINLNAANVAISTNISIGGNLDVDSHTNLDNVSIAGVTTFAGALQGTTGTFSGNVTGNQGTFGGNISGPLLSITGASGNDGTILLNSAGGTNSDFARIRQVLSDDSFRIESKASGSYQSILKGTSDRVIELHYQGDKKLETTNTGINVTGAITVNGSATSAWTVGHNGSSNYVISGPGGLSSANNPDLYLERGQTYQFIMNASGHGFGIQTSSGTWNSSNAYTTGITNAGAATGTITFAVPYSAPARLYYACTSQHSGMVGNIYISGGQYDTKSNLPYFYATADPSVTSNYIHSFGNLHGNNGSHYNNTTGRFTAPVAGFYWFAVGIWCNNSSGTSALIQLTRNINSSGSNVSFAGANHRTQYNSLNCSGGTYMEANDYVWIQQTGVSIQASTPRNYFSGYYVG